MAISDVAPGDRGSRARGPRDRRRPVDGPVVGGDARVRASAAPGQPRQRAPLSPSSRRSPEALEEAFPPASVERLTVGPLSVGALHAVLRERLGVALPRPMQLRLHEVSGGNPFYALEVARGRPPDTSADVSAPLRVPASLERVIDARLGHARRRDPARAPAGRGSRPLPGWLPLRAMSIAPDGASSAPDKRAWSRSQPVWSGSPTRSSRRRSTTSAAGRGRGAPRTAAGHDRRGSRPSRAASRARRRTLRMRTSPRTIESAANLARDRGVSIAAAELADHALRLTPPEDVENRHRRAAAAARAHSAAGEAARARAIAAGLVADSPAAGREPRRSSSDRSSRHRRPRVAMLEEALAEAVGRAGAPGRDPRGSRGKRLFRAERADGLVERHAMASLRLAERLDDDALRAKALSILALNRLQHGGREGALGLAERAYRLAARLEDPLLLQRRPVGRSGMCWPGSATRIARATGSRASSPSGRIATSGRGRSSSGISPWSSCGPADGALAGDYADQCPGHQRRVRDRVAVRLLPAALLALHKGELERARSLSERALSMEGEAQGLKAYHGIIGACDLWTGDPEAGISTSTRAEQATDDAGSERAEHATLGSGLRGGVTAARPHRRSHGPRT